MDLAALLFQPLSRQRPKDEQLGSALVANDAALLLHAKLRGEHSLLRNKEINMQLLPKPAFKFPRSTLLTLLMSVLVGTERASLAKAIAITLGIGGSFLLVDVVIRDQRRCSFDGK